MTDAAPSVSRPSQRGRANRACKRAQILLPILRQLALKSFNDLTVYRISPYLSLLYFHMKAKSYWKPWGKKISYKCPYCHAKSSLHSPILPNNFICPRCSNTYSIMHATYPLWKLFLFFIVCLLSVGSFSEGTILWFPEVLGRYLFFVILCFIITPSLFSKSRKRMKIPIFYYMSGCLGSSGWIIVLILSVLLRIASDKAREADQEKRQSRDLILD